MTYISQVNGKNVPEEYAQTTDKKNETPASTESTVLDEVESDIVSLTDEVTKTLNDLSSGLKTVNSSNSSDVSSVLSNIQALKSNIEVYTSQITYLEEQIEAKQSKLDDLMEKLEEVQKEYDELEAKLEEKQEDLEETNEEIDKINKQIEKLTQIISNPESDEAELQAATSKLGAYNKQLADLYSVKSSLEDDITTLTTKMENKANIISQYQSQVSKYETDLSSLTTQKSDIETQKSNAEKELRESILSVVSEAEWKLVEDNNIDLTEKMENGEPRYIFAQGKSDNKYHIYDMQTGSSLARQYCPNGGYDVIESGSGYINGFTKTGEGSGSPVYYMEDCGSIGSCNACYSTCSPLSFDINGDGVQTSDKVINYDIDGDGILDKINDSADAVLVFDKDGDGISGADGSECFGNNTDLDGDNVKDGFSDGFAALKAFAQQNNLINGIDDNVLDENDIKYLEENFGFKIKLNGYESEAVSLSDVGITEINLASTDETTLIDNFDGQGNQLMTQQGATFTMNGETKEYADIWHKKILSDVDNVAKVFSGDSLSFNLANAFAKRSIFNNQALSFVDNKDGQREIKAAQKEAEEKLEELNDEE